MTLMVLAAVLAALAQDAPALEMIRPAAGPAYRKATVAYKDLKAEDARLNGAAHAVEPHAISTPQTPEPARRPAKAKPRPSAPKLRPAFALRGVENSER